MDCVAMSKKTMKAHMTWAFIERCKAIFSMPFNLDNLLIETIKCEVFY